MIDIYTDPIRRIHIHFYGMSFDVVNTLLPGFEPLVEYVDIYDNDHYVAILLVTYQPKLFGLGSQIGDLIKDFMKWYRGMVLVYLDGTLMNSVCNE